MSKIVQINRRTITSAIVLAATILTGCSGIHQYTIDRLGDTLAAGSSGYGSDDDLELIRQASPFGLKLMESVLLETPHHATLLTATAAGFMQYAYAYVQQDADELELRDVQSARVMHHRAVALYRRARIYGFRALAVRHTDFNAQLKQDAKLVLADLDHEDMAPLYWSTVATAAIITLSKDDPQTIAELPLLEKMVGRLQQLDENYDHGALHSFLISYEMSRPGSRQPEISARHHFERAIYLAEGERVAPYVAFAEAACVATQNRQEFIKLLSQAITISSPRKHPEWRLENELMQRRARWLLSQVDQLFLE